MSNNKVKGLLKGLRFISQVFDAEKEPEIQIGHPTDVKHVAHIGWDGPSVNSNPPSWMKEYKSVPGFSSAPLNLNGDIHNKGPENSVKWVSEDTDSTKRSSRRVNCQGQGKDLPELPRPSKQESMGNIRESHAKEKSDKPRQPKKSSKHSHSNSQPKDSPNGSISAQQPMPMDVVQVSDSGRSLSDIPKKSRSKKSNSASSSSGGGSSGLRSGTQPMDPDSNEGTQPRSVSKSRNKNKPRPSEKDGQSERGPSEISCENLN